MVDVLIIVTLDLGKSVWSDGRCWGFLLLVWMFDKGCWHPFSVLHNLLSVMEQSEREVWAELRKSLETFALSESNVKKGCPL